jgi:hypothetical protein
MNQAELIDKIAADGSNTGVSKTAIKWVLDAQAKGAYNNLPPELNSQGDLFGA